MATTTCACSELEGCGWCSHTKSCAPYPECSTTCEECDPTCNNHQHCLDKCYRRFHAPRESPNSDADDGFTFPPSPQDINCAIGIFCATVLASAAGIGGGAVLVPLFTMISEFTEHEAIPLSIATVFGASAFSTLGNFVWEKHPAAPHRPMIAYDAALVLLPMTLLGSTGGVFLNMVCPDWMIVGLLVALCAYSGRRTVTQAYKRREKEDPPSARHEALAEALVGEELDDGAAPEGHEGEMQEGATTTKSSSKAIGEGVLSDAPLRAKQLLTHSRGEQMPVGFVNEPVRHLDPRDGPVHAQGGPWSALSVWGDLRHAGLLGRRAAQRARAALPHVALGHPAGRVGRAEGRVWLPVRLIGPKSN